MGMTNGRCDDPTCRCCYPQHECHFDYEDFPVCKDCGQKWEKRPITDAPEHLQKLAAHGPGYFFRQIKGE